MLIINALCLSYSESVAVACAEILMETLLYAIHGQESGFLSDVATIERGTVALPPLITVCS